jgi:hypothetical protein
MDGVATRFDGQTLVVRIPMHFQRRGGRKRIVAPDGSESRILRLALLAPEIVEDILERRTS